tara:strand:- start:5734 stop:7803 length:2070 start_codon:yes stop_codon:yes gene_type:complete
LVAPRDLFEIIPVWLIVFGISTFGFMLSFWLIYDRALRLVWLGRSTVMENISLKRVFKTLWIVLGQVTVFRGLGGPVAAISHALIFWGFIIFVFSYVFFIFIDSSGWLIVDIIHQNQYTDSRSFTQIVLGTEIVRWIHIVLDIFSIIILFVIGWAMVRRWIIKPTRLSHKVTQSSDAVWVLVLTMSLMITSLLSEATFLSLTYGNELEKLIFLETLLVSIIQLIPISELLMTYLFDIFWLAHFVLIVGFSIYLPTSKHLHLFTAPLNIFLSKEGPLGTLHTPNNLEEAERFGTGYIEDFSRKQILDGFSCTVCGRCTEVCPQNIVGRKLSPMHIVQGIKSYSSEVGKFKVSDDVESNDILNSTIEKEDIWDCLTCGACIEICPVGVDQVDTIVDIRRYLVMEQADVPENFVKPLIGLEDRGHPWQGVTENRLTWCDGLEVPSIQEKGEADVLLWVGCAGAFDKRCQQVMRSFVSVLNKAEIEFAILGNEEACTGDPARRIGNEYLYQQLAKSNIEKLNQYKFNTLLTWCPHCFNVMKNEYPHLQGNYSVKHYVEFFNDLISKRIIEPSLPLDSQVAYHDSCYLGRHNGLFEEPRSIVKSIPMLELVEFKRCKNRSFCCGAGGGQLWNDTKEKKQVSHERTKEFLETNAQTVGVSCPFCLQMLDEGISSQDDSNKKNAYDLIELLDKSTN